MSPLSPHFALCHTACRHAALQKSVASAGMRAALAKQHKPNVTISMVHQAGSKRVFVAIIEMIAGAQNYVFE